MKTEIKEIYKCDHCNKLYQIKSFAIKHEERCSKNPENFRACFGCEHLGKKDAKVHTGYDDYFSCEPIYEFKTLLFCSKKNTFLYPPISEHKGNVYSEFDDDSQQNNPMPKECCFRENESIEHILKSTIK